MANDKYLIVVVGPTAVGKTSVSIDLAKHYNTEVISADSRQFYKEMEIGTAKPSDEELAMVVHHFINSHSINEEVSAGSYEKLALAKLEDLFTTHNYVILTGGSGLYINAVTEGLAEMPEVPSDIRIQLNRQLANEGLKSLQQRLKMHDPEYYKKVDIDNPQRIIRALEVFEATGRPYSAFRKQSGSKRPFNAIKIGLTRPREELYERINLRMDLMISQGLFDEAQSLYPYKGHNALQTVGYKEIFDYYDGLYNQEEAIRLLKRNSRRYAKRQMTWFRKDESTAWFHPNQLEEIFQYVREKTQG